MHVSIPAWSMFMESDWRWCGIWLGPAKTSGSTWGDIESI
jgi:hypothetical protein